MQGLSALLAIALFIRAVVAREAVLLNQGGSRQICGGIYGKDDWNGKHDPSITVTFPEAHDKDGSVAVVIFAYEDIGALGVVVSEDEGNEALQFICDPSSVAAGHCTEEELGTVIVDKYAAHVRPIVSNRVDFPYSGSIEYPVEGTDYYCVAAISLNDQSSHFAVKVKMLNPYGWLDASEIALIPFHFAMSGAYFLISLLWAWKYMRPFAILKVQKYITILLVIMVVEQAIVGAYYTIVNVNLHPKLIMGLLALFTAFRLAYTFFLVTIVSLGYSIVYPSLGPNMRLCKILGALVFITDFLFSLDAYYTSGDGYSSSLMGDFILLPLAVVVAVNYVWILRALSDTANYLLSRKQHAKFQMYRRLWWVLAGSAFAILGFVVVHGLVTLAEGFRQFVTTYWKYKWLLSDGWPNIVFFFAFSIVCFLWRPTSRNEQFAMSTQLAQSEADAEEFEIGSLNGSDDEDVGPPAGPPPSYRTNSNEPPVFDGENNHGLSDLDDEDLHSAPSGRI